MYILQLQLKDLVAKMSSYNAFLYPPDYQLARLHQSCSRPGLSLQPQKLCPCCSKKQRSPFKSWFTRNIDKDFKNYGGSVVTYFWLLKLYIAIVAFVAIFYGTYLTYLIQENCNQQVKECKSLLGIWILSNQTLVQMLKKKDQNQTIFRLLTFRGITFVVLMLANAASLIIVKLFKRLYPSKLSVADYSVLFNNIHISSAQMILKLKQQFPKIQLKQTVQLCCLEPFNTLYQQKLSTFYLIQNEQKQKVKQKLIKRLFLLTKKCQQEQSTFKQQKGQKMLIVFNTIDDKKRVLNRYAATGMETVKHALLTAEEDRKLYCEQAPKPEEIIWNNIGSTDGYKVKYKLLSIVYFLLLLAGSYLLLFFCMAMIYNGWLNQPWNTIAINVVLTFLVFVALTFRSFMNKLSQLSHPSTLTNRTMFIVLTTISFHFIFYIIIPTFYFSWAQDQHKNQILKMISNQVLNFIVFQFIIAGVDLAHCCWNKRLKQVQDQSRPYGCQKVLHQQMQYPRFPIQFKLIVLFKIWSFTIFFAFQSPFMLVVLFCVLIFLFVKDKHSVYYHYRVQIIQNRVQFSFLKVYSTFFSVYMFAIFVLTQHLEIQFYMALAFTIFMVAIQLGYLGRYFEKNQQNSNDTNQYKSTLVQQISYDQLEHQQSYKRLYQHFVENIQNDAFDIKVKQFLQQNGLGSLRTEENLI